MIGMLPQKMASQPSFSSQVGLNLVRKASEANDAAKTLLTGDTNEKDDALAQTALKTLQEAEASIGKYIAERSNNKLNADFAVVEVDSGSSIDYKQAVKALFEEASKPYVNMTLSVGSPDSEKKDLIDLPGTNLGQEFWQKDYLNLTLNTPGSSKSNYSITIDRDGNIKPYGMRTDPRTTPDSAKKVKEMIINLAERLQNPALIATMPDDMGVL